MGDKIVITNIEVIQGGLFQINIHNQTTNKHDRIFIKPDELFGMMGESMGKNHIKYLKGD